MSTRKRATQAETAPAPKRAPPRCRKGCKDPDDPALGPLKANCSCSHSKARSRVDNSTTTGSTAAPAPAPAPAPAAAAAPASAAIGTAESTITEALRVAEEALALEAAREAARLAAEETGAGRLLSPSPLPRSLPSFARLAPSSSGSSASLSDSRVCDQSVLLGGIDAPPSFSQAEQALRSINALEDSDAVTTPDADLGTESERGAADDISSSLEPEGCSKKRKKEMNDAEGASIWLDLNNAHNQLKITTSYETEPEARARYIRRGVWRVARSLMNFDFQVAELGARTGTAVFFAFANLEPGKHKLPHYVYADPVLCDPSRGSLHDMAASMFKTWVKETDFYRESQRAGIVDQLRERHEWQQKEIEYQERIRQLETRVAAQDIAQASTLQLQDPLADDESTSNLRSLATVASGRQDQVE